MVRMRLSSLLLGPSAFCLLFGAIGLALGSFFLLSLATEEFEAGVVGVKLASALLTIGGTLLLLALAFTAKSDRPHLRSSVNRWIIVAAIMVIPTGLLFGPTGGFHHIIGFGPFPYFYMMWDGDGPPTGGYEIIHGYEVRFDPLRLSVLILVWVLIISVVIWRVKPWRIR